MLINNIITFMKHWQSILSRNIKNKAMMINSYTMDNTFSASHLDGSTLIALENVKTGEYTKPLFINTRRK